MAPVSPPQAGPAPDVRFAPVETEARSNQNPTGARTPPWEGLAVVC